MKFDETYQPEYESLKDLLVDMAIERSVDVLLDLIVNRMAARPHVALVRIWLLKDGDRCPDCRMKDACPRQTKCLHLTAEKSKSIIHSEKKAAAFGRHHHRIPVGKTCIGMTAALKRALTPEEIEADPDWQNRHIWAEGENILGFGSQPLQFKDNVFGVIAIYSRIKAGRVKEGRFWLKMIANHTAAAIANANAFTEIDHLKSQLELENEYLKEEINQARVFGDLIGKSPSLMNILNQIELVAPTDAGVLILGESGTGKELVAREIHKRSRRSSKPMIKVNCASIPSELYESEFFGHVKGAFTGAVKNRAGRFQAADGGTLFLDEIGELPLSLQGKLLRVLQEGTYERIGEETTRHANVRIIAATNRNIKKEMAAGRFRQDLYYRLNVFPIEIEPLRRRKEDIPPLTYHFLEKISSEMNRPLPEISSAGIDQLINYDWPGNVRELRNAIERSIIVSGKPPLKFVFPDQAGQGTYKKTADPIESDQILTEKEVRLFIRNNIIAALKACNGKIYGPNGAARLLGCAPTTLSSRIKKLNILPEEVKTTHI